MIDDSMIHETQLRNRSEQQWLPSETYLITHITIITVVLIDLAFKWKRGLS